MSDTKINCVQCKIPTPHADLRSCYYCGISVHPKCISSLISDSGSCSCGGGCLFVESTSRTNKRAHFDISESSTHVDLDSSQIPEPVSFSPHVEKLNDTSTIKDFAIELAEFFKNSQKRDDAIATHTRLVLQSVSETVSSHSNEIAKVKKTVDKHGMQLSLFELTVGGIHGEKPDQVRSNFVDLCCYLKVPIDSTDIVYTRFLKRTHRTKP